MSERKLKKKTEIEAIVEKIEALQAEMGIKQLNSPWLPPLAHRLSRKLNLSSTKHEINFAIIDEPEKQSQTVFHYDVLEDGNIGVFGSSGYGKSHTVLTLLLSMAERFNPEEMHYYLFDFGNGTLLPLKQLPHTADFFLMDEQRKIEKFIKELKNEISRRKLLFQKQEVSSIKMYNTVSEEKLPLLFLTIDNFDLIKEEMQELEAQMNQFARDGQSLGIYMIVTATRVQSIRQALMNSLKTKIVHYLMDSGEAFTILGRIPFTPEPIPGRAIIKKEDSYFSQVFLPADGKDDYELLELIRKDVRSIKEKYENYKRPNPIPMLPTELTTLNFIAYLDDTQQAGKLPIGLDEELVQPVYIDLVKNKHCLVLGQAQKGKTNVLKLLVNSLLNSSPKAVAIFDSFDRGLSSYASEESVSYLETKEQITDWLSGIEQLLIERESEYVANLQSGQLALNNHQPIVLVIDGYARFSQMIDSPLQDRLSKLMKNFSHLGFHMLVSGSNNDLTKGYDSLTVEMKQIRQAVLLMKKSEQTLFTLSYERKEEEIHPGYGYYVINAKEMKIQIPLCATERMVYA